MANGNYLEPSGGLLRGVMDAHGGFSAWNHANTVRAVMSTGGALFLMRTTRDAFRQTEVIVDLRSPRTEIRDFPRGGLTGFFEPNRTWIEDRDGKVLAQRNNPTQAFYFDRRGYLRRHDYHAKVIGPYAVASHYCGDHQTFGKGVFPTRRRVVPRTGTGKTLPFPTLVWIQVHEAALSRS